MNKITELLKHETGPSPYSSLATKLGVTDQYIRMLDSGKAEPGWRLQRDIDDLYGKVVK